MTSHECYLSEAHNEQNAQNADSFLPTQANYELLFPEKNEAWNCAFKL